MYQADAIRDGIMQLGFLKEQHDIDGMQERVFPIFPLRQQGVRLLGLLVEMRKERKQWFARIQENFGRKDLPAGLPVLEDGEDLVFAGGHGAEGMKEVLNTFG